MDKWLKYSVSDWNATQSQKPALLTLKYLSCRCLIILDSVPAANEDQRKGVEIVRHALKQPMMQIAKNAGVDASVIVNKVMEADDPNLGYDALNGIFVNMMDAGIIDPTKVRNANIFSGSRNLAQHYFHILKQKSLFHSFVCRCKMWKINLKNHLICMRLRLYV